MYQFSSVHSSQTFFNWLSLDRRSSSGLDVSDVGLGSTSQLGSLHCSIRYCFDKNALVVTVNKCQNLPAKDAAAKSR